MTFCEALNTYVRQLGCQAKDIAEASGLRIGTVSRCLKGTYIPAAESDSIPKLAKGIVQLSEQKSRPLSYEEVFQQLSCAEREAESPSYQYFSERVRSILKMLHISHAELAREMHSDPSTISRYLSGRKKPSELAHFSANFSAMIANRAADREAYEQLAAVFGCNAEELRTPAILRKRLLKWIAAPSDDLRERNLDSFLNALDAFDLREFEEHLYIQEFNLPTVPYIMPALEIYHGIEEFKQCEMHFLKASVLSKSREDIIMYSDMPFRDLMEDTVFRKRYQFGMSLLIKKGVRIHAIQYTHRPVQDILQDMERMIPLYMSGQAKLYYFPKPQRDVFCHLIRVSGAAAMYGIAVSEVHQDGIYMLTKNKGSVTDYRRTAKAMLRNARPFIEVFTPETKDLCFRRMAALWDRGSRRLIMSCPPVSTASEALLLRILQRHHVDDSAAASEMFSSHRRFLVLLENLLKSYSVTLEIPEMDEAQFAAHQPWLNLTDVTYGRRLSYRYEEYREHLRLTKEFAASHKNFILRNDPAPVFRNLNLMIVEDRGVMIFKNNNPPTQFLIYHPELLRVFERYVPPLPES